jgi:hypothetical protein
MCPHSLINHSIIKIPGCDEGFPCVAKRAPITWGEIKKELNKENITLDDDDVIYHELDEGFYSENNSIDPHYSLRIIRKRLETDEEYEKRITKLKKLNQKHKNERFETYLELKKEFENEDK